jgi:hypothetical protein
MPFNHNRRAAAGCAPPGGSTGRLQTKHLKRIEALREKYQRLGLVLEVEEEGGGPGRKDRRNDRPKGAWKEPRQDRPPKGDRGKDTRAGRPKIN